MQSQMFLRHPWSPPAAGWWPRLTQRVIILLLALLAGLLPLSVYAEAPPAYLSKWGGFGRGNGQFDSPFGVAIDSSGNVYVADGYNHRIQKFDSSGTYLTQWGSFGSGNGQFSTPFGVAVDSSGNVYVADSNNGRIQKFDSSGTYLTQWGSLGSGNGQFNTPFGVATDSSGNVYVTDRLNHRIQKFDSSGTYLSKWGSLGSGNGQFSYPDGVATDSSGNVYVADMNNARIQKFDSSGTYLTKWGSFGGGNGQFYNPAGVATDSSGNVYVVDSSNHRIQKFDSSGGYLSQWGSNGGGNGQFRSPFGVATDSSGNVYVADQFNHRIQKFAPITIDLQGNGVAIASGDNTPSNADNTDFGAVAVNATASKAFSLRNTGNTVLTVSTINVSGPQAGEFQVLAPTSFPLTIAAGGAQTITVQLQPTGVGIRRALLTIASDNIIIPTYTVALQGGTPAPGAALAFDGVNDVVELPATLNSQINSQITVEGWFYPTASVSGNSTMLIGDQYSADANIKFVLYQADSTVVCGFFNGSWYQTSAVAITLNTWQHLACSYDQQNIKLYVNGAVATTQAATAALANSTSVWYLGRRWDADVYYRGQMDEIRIWNRALSASEIGANQNCELGSTPSGLVARYAFNQGVAAADNSSVTSLTDNSGSSDNGTLWNFALSGSASNWVEPGSSVNGVTCAGRPGINVQGNGVSIANGDTTPDSADGTDVGSTAAGSGSVVKPFTIQNSGTAALTLSGSPLVTITGDSAFSISGQPASSSLAVGASTTFTITFAPSTSGIFTATVSIANNDAEQNPYTFVVQGSTPLPGAALAFDGTDDYVAIPALNLNTNSVTFEAWIYPDGTQNPFTGLMEVRGNDNNLGLLLRNNNELGYLWGNAYWDFASNLTVPSNQWSHVALVVEPTKATLYLNGVAATNSAAHPVKAFDTPLDLGTDRPSPGRQFKGRMDEVRVWNRALSAGEIAADSNCELGSTPGGLVARYNFNQGMAAADNSSVTSLTDGSGNSRHGALTGFALSGSTSNWVAPGSPASGVACLDRPDIAVQGNGAAIANGDTTPSSADGTAFGPLSTGKLLTRTFTIGNVGTAALTGVAVTVNGNSAFSLSTPPAATVSPNGSSSFVITFDPDALGEVTATISIASNDSDESPYTFAISGAGVAPYADVTIVLDTRPNSPANLAFTGGLGSFMLDDPTSNDGDAYSNRKSFRVAPGSYTVSRNAATTWYVTAIACTPAGGATINLAQRRAALTLADGDNVTCTFTVDRAVTIRARVFNDLVRRTTNLGKRNAGDPWLNGWALQASTAPTATAVSRMTQPTGETGLYEALFEYLRPGAYTVCAVLPTGAWTPTTPSTLDPAYGKPCKSVTLSPGQAATVLFGAYQTTVTASEAFTPEDESITDEDSIIDQPYNPAEEETVNMEEGVLRLFLPLINR